MNPMAPEKMAPTMKARVRKVPDWAKVRETPRTSPSASLLIAVEVRNTTTATGTTMMAMVRNWRRR